MATGVIQTVFMTTLATTEPVSHRIEQDARPYRLGQERIGSCLARSLLISRQDPGRGDQDR
jgi:hypothetical protein